jgi:hypothetical protein
LEKMYNRFAILRIWNYQFPEKCEFTTEKISATGNAIPRAVEEKIRSDFFDRNEFRKFLIKRAEESEFMGSVIDDLAEPPPPSEGEAIPFIGETQIYELALDVAAEGHIAVNRSGSWIVRRPEDTTDSDARAYIKSRAFCIGQEMRRIRLGLPGNVGGGSVKSTSAQSPVPGQNPIKEPGSIITANGNELTNKTDAPFPLIQAEIQTKRSVEPATVAHLSGLFETWGIASNTLLETAKIEFSDLTVQQLRQVLQRIPYKLKASIEISFKERSDQ